MKTLTEIEQLTKQYSAARADLSATVTKLNDTIERLKRIRLPHIKRAVAKAQEHRAALEAAIDDSRLLFVKPRTIIFHGIKVGLTKGKGGIEILDTDRTIKLIEKHFPAQADILIRTKKSPNKKALEELTVADLKRLGCIVEETGDQIVIKATDSEVDKIVNALLKGGESEEE